MTGHGSDPSAVAREERLQQFQLIYDYVKFHIGLYLATPPLLVIIADGLNVSESPWFVGGLILSIGGQRIDTVAERLGVKSDVVDRLEQWIKDYSDLLAEGQRLLTGV